MGAQALGSYAEGAGPRAPSGMEISQTAARLQRLGWDWPALSASTSYPRIPPRVPSCSLQWLLRVSGWWWGHCERASGKDDNQGGGGGWERSEAGELGGGWRMLAGAACRGKHRLGAWKRGFCSQIHHQVGGWGRPLLLSMSSSLSCTPESLLSLFHLVALGGECVCVSNRWGPVGSNPSFSLTSCVTWGNSPSLSGLFCKTKIP